MDNDMNGLYIEERPEHWVFCRGDMSILIYCKPQPPATKEAV